MAEALPSGSSEISPPGSPRGRIFQKVVGSELTIKPQQRGEPDLTEEEKVAYLSSLLSSKPGAFLMRFGKVLDQQDLAFFSGSSDYEVQFRVKQLSRDLAPENRWRRTSNRRYECMKELMKTDYFSEEEMRQRNPLLFQRYVGQYMSEEEVAELDGGQTSDMTLSSFILQRMRLDERRERERRQQEREEEVEEEEDSSSEEETEEETEEEVTEEEKKEMKRQFLQAMQLSFLGGKDTGFDYSSVDQDERYDSLETQQQDGEDAYFDAEEPQWYTDKEQTPPATHEEHMCTER